MDSALFETIARRPDEERERRGIPEGFPNLPSVPARRYVDAELYAAEQDAIFGKSWLFVAHDDEIPEPGDFQCLDQFVAPMFLLRGEDGSVRAFYNSCRHRGGPVVSERRGHAEGGLVCGYHGWSYGLDGRLVGVPQARDFGSLDRACLGLPQVRCERWGSFHFVSFDPEAEPLHDALGIVGEDLGPQIADDAKSGPVRLVEQRSMEVEGNWKLIVDANVETYHVNVLHQQSAAMVLDQTATGIFLLPRGHSRMLVGFRDGVSLPIDLPPFPEASRLADLGIYSYHLFPNLSLVYGGSRSLLFLISSWPLSPDRSRFDVRFFAATPADGPHAETIQMVIEANWNVFLEDLSTIPYLQRSISSGALEELRLSYPERRIAHQHEEIDRRIGPKRIPPSLRATPSLEKWIER